MIRPLESRLLKPAGYELTLGPRCLVEGEPAVLTTAEPDLVIRKNAVVFVSMQQVLCLPHYIVARFNLTIDLVYCGLLLGTGPQVDPGYQGALSCPLHNISSEEITIRLGDPIAKMDFVKTVPRDDGVREELRKIHNEHQLALWLKSERAPDNVRLFKEGNPDWVEPVFGYLKGRKPRSSVQQLSADIRQTRDEVDEQIKESRSTIEKLRNQNLLALVAVVAGIAALIFAALQLSDGLSTTKQELQGLRSCMQSLTVQLEAHETAHVTTPTRTALARCLAL